MYNYKEVDKLIARYNEIEGANCTQLSEGVLGSGDWVLTAPNKKTAIVKEVPVNEWTSTHTIKMYNKTPKKYIKFI